MTDPQDEQTVMFDEESSPMSDPPLSEQPEVETADTGDEEEDLPDHPKQPKRKPGDPNPLDELSHIHL